MTSVYIVYINTRLVDMVEMSGENERKVSHYSCIRFARRAALIDGKLPRY